MFGNVRTSQEGSFSDHVPTNLRMICEFPGSGIDIPSLWNVQMSEEPGNKLVMGDTRDERVQLTPQPSHYHGVGIDLRTVTRSAEKSHKRTVQLITVTRYNDTNEKKSSLE